MKTIEEIIVEKEYFELTQEELNLVADLAENEQEYKAMRSLFGQMETEIVPDSVFEASESTKKSLDSIFMAKYPVIAQDWKKEELEEETKVIPFYNNNWFRAAAVLLLFSGTSYYFFQSSEFTTENKKEERSLAIQTPAATKSPLTENKSKAFESAMPQEHNSKSVDTKENIKTVEAEASWAEDMAESSVQPTSSGSVSYYFSSPSLKDAGMSADLNPNGTVADMDDEHLSDGSSTEVTTEDMLSWIQTVY